MSQPITGDDSVRIAMWSGPRNLSTAMMRAWENRPDTAVVDEPFYACYLKFSGAKHPFRDEVLAGQSSDWHAVARKLTAETPGGRRIFYQKHMTHHMLPEAPLEWLERVSHAFLIRHPQEVSASWAHALKSVPSLDELGYVRQVELFDRIADTRGEAPPVFDSRDVLERPEPALRALCNALRVPFDERMLSWPEGPRETDGVWAPHWYQSVWRSSGFGPARRQAQPAPELLPVIDAALPFYERLAQHRIPVEGQ
ncbi:MAG TPA: hypothetical protein VFY27_13290 [Woeseiaceae bacterium]|nr:hypothetical protein [Woeseiaceae bacterium]